VMRYMEVGTLKIQIVKKDIKNIHLAVYPPHGNVRLASPKSVSDDTIRLYVVSKLGWIRKQQRRFSTQDREPVREFVERESHYFLGQRYLLRVVEKEARPTVTINNKYLTIQVRPGTTKEQKAVAINEWYREKLKEMIPALIGKWASIMKVDVANWGVKQMRTKWGTCNIEAKRIWLNLELAKKPLPCLEFIVVHEMVHLLERKHNEVFIAYMNKFLPKWKSVKEELNRLPVRHAEWGY
jgi:predicted metal-dependent hydrolase